MSSIKCNLDGNTIVESSVPSRRRYEFTPSNNFTIPIDETNSIAEGFVWRIDVSDLLSKKRQYRACCMGQDVNLNLFEEV